jgi:hypothetical protein
LKWKWRDDRNIGKIHMFFSYVLGIINATQPEGGREKWME